MRIESSIKGWFAVVAVSVSAVSCDMLDIMQDNKLSVSNMWKTAEQVEGSTYGIYSELRSNFVQSQINVFYWGEARVGEYMWGAGSWRTGHDNDMYGVQNSTMNDSNASTVWTKLYTAVNAANAVLKYAPLKSDFVRAVAADETVKTKIDADMYSVPDETVIEAESYEVDESTGEVIDNEQRDESI